jgi:hypothetical protein
MYTIRFVDELEVRQALIYGRLARERKGHRRFIGCGAIRTKFNG